MHSRFAAIVAMASVCLLPIAAARAQTPSTGQALIDMISPSIVSMRIVIKAQAKAAGQAQEAKINGEGVVVTSDGLIMMSNAPVSSNVLPRLMGIDPDEHPGLSITPTDFKVTFGNEEKEYDAFLAATDPKLGLAFIKIVDLGNRKLPVIDFSNCPPINVGDQIAAVTRLGKGYDYAPVYSEGPVKGVISKPRNAFLVSTTILSIGLPVFTTDGKTLGMMLFLPAASDNDANDVLMRYYSGAAADRMGIFLVPGSVVQPIIGEAIDQAAKVAADRAKNPPPAPAPAPSTTKPAPAPAPAPSTKPAPAK